MFIRSRRWVPLVCASAFIAACGSAANSPAPSTAQTSTPQPSSSASAKVNPADLILATSALPQTETWTQTSDQSLGGQSDAWQRAWKNQDGTQGLEVDVVYDGSTAAATKDWTEWNSKVSAKVTSGGSTPCPSGAPAACTEVVGSWASDPSKGGVVIVWQEGPVLVAVVVVDANGTGNQGEDQSNAEATATSEGQELSALLS